MRRTLFIFFALLCTTHYAIGQSAALNGRVIDQQSGEGLVGATIGLGDAGAYTDSEGRYSIRIPPGKYEIHVSYVGYKPYVDSLTFSSGETRELNFELLRGSTVLRTATVTTGRQDKALGEVTVSLDILQPGLIANANKTNMVDALEKVPGVRIIDRQANIRGGSGFSQGAGSRVLLLVDDIPILQADAGFPNWNDVPIELVDQVEVVKGAASALYGSSAMNGIINVRTILPSLEPRTNGALFSTIHLAPRRAAAKWWDSAPYILGGQFSHARRMDRFDLVVGGFLQTEKGFRKNFEERYGRIVANTRYRLSDRLTLGLNANFNTGSRESYFYWRGMDSLYVGVPNTFSKNNYTRFNIDPNLTYFDRSGNRHRLLTRLYSVDNNITNDRANASLQYYAEYQFQRSFRPIQLVLTAGLVATGSKVKAILYGDTTFIQRNYAGYVQLDKKVFDRLNLSAGFRYESNFLDNPGFTFGLGTVEPSRETEAKPVFRLGANYQVFENTYLRASYGQAYRFPTIAEKYIVTDVGGFFVEPNPSLGSETGWSTEIGFKQGFQVGSFEGYLDFAAFLFKYQDMMEFNLTESAFVENRTAFKATNIGGTTTQGYEVSIAGRGELFGIPTTLLTGYTYIDPRFDEFNPDFEGMPEDQGDLNAGNSSSKKNILKYRSQHTFKGDMESQFGAFSLGFEVFYASHMEAIDRVFNGIVPGLQTFRREHDQGYWLLNLRAAWRMNDMLKLSVLLNNLFNEEYSVRPGLLDAPRNIALRMDFKL